MDFSLLTLLDAAARAGAGVLAGLPLAQAEGGAAFNLVSTFTHAEIVGKSIVVLLLFFSLLGWTIMIGKYLDLSRLRQTNLAFQSRLRGSTTLLGANLSAALRHSGPYARLLHDAVEAGRQHRGDANASVRMGLIENALQRAVAEECVRYEAKMVVLGSLVSGAPFIGLFGTVWGVMVAFGGMGASGNTSLQNLAPGVASALLATVCGLIVAIPAVFGYNLLLTQVKMMITELENFASLLADRMELELEGEGAGGAAPVAPVTPVAPPAAPATPVPTPAVRESPSPAAPPLAPVPAVAATPARPDPAVTAAERYLRLDLDDGDERLK